MKTGLAVVGFLLLVSIGTTLFLLNRYSHELPPVQDVICGLLYFIEQNDGRFPASEEEFVASSFIERRTDGSIRVLAPAGTKFKPKTNGVVIGNLKPFKIAWGADLDSLRMSEYGRALDKDGRVVELISWPSSPVSGKQNTITILALRQQFFPAPP